MNLVPVSEIDSGLDKLLEKFTEKFEHLDGESRFRRRVNGEKRYLTSLSRTEKADQCNLKFLTVVMNCVEQQFQVCSVFTTMADQEIGKVQITICSHGGRIWIKINNQSPETIMHKILNKEHDNILVVSEKLLKMARKKNVLGEMPIICWFFCQAVPEKIALRLKEMGILIHGRVKDLEEEQDKNQSEIITQNNDDRSLELIENYLHSSLSSSLPSSTIRGGGYFILCPELRKNDNKINLHFLTFCTLVSDLAKEPNVALMNMIEGKEIISCHSNWVVFEKIVISTGSEDEKSKMELLKNKITFVPDLESERIKHIKTNNVILNVCSTGDVHNVLTILPKHLKFLACCRSQNVHLSLWLHDVVFLSGFDPKAANLKGFIKNKLPSVISETLQLKSEE